MKRRRPVGLALPHVPIILWPFVAVALLGYALFLVCKGIILIIQEIRKTKNAKAVAEASMNNAINAISSGGTPARRAPTLGTPTRPARYVRIPVTVDPDDEAYERWKAGEKSKPPIVTVGGKKVMGRSVSMDDLAVDESKWEPF